jgi:hypothetical protein
MKPLRLATPCALCAVLLALTGAILPQTAAPQSAAPQSAAPKTAAPKKAAPAAPAALTNQDIIKLVQAKLGDDLVVSKIKTSRTRFDTSVDGLIALRQAGVSDRVIALMINPAAEAAAPPAPRTTLAATSPPEPAPAPAPVTLRPGFTPSNAAGTAAPNVTLAAAKSPPRPADPGQAPPNYGVYVQFNGELKPLGRVQSKVQLSKLRTVVKNWVPFMREKIDINIPGAHSTSRYEILRPNFYAYFPPSRDVSKFKLLQAKITGQKYDQRTIANASILFSTEQNQDEVLCDIGPTSVKDLYRISPREDLPSGEFGFVEGNTGSKSTSNIEIIDVYDFGIDRKEDKLPLPEYLTTLPAADLPDPAFLEWTKEDCQKIVDDREAKLGLTGSLMGPFKRQFASLDVYWADTQFAQAFARLEMLDKQLTPEQARKLAGLLISKGNDQYYILVSIGGKIGSGHLIGANEGERLMRPFDATLTDEKGKEIVPATKLEFIGGYADLWKVTFDQKSIRGPLLSAGGTELDFEARLNQNLDFKAKFPMERISAKP